MPKCNTKVLYLQAGKPLVYVRSKVNLFGLLGATVFLKSLPDFLLNGPKMAEGSVVGSSLPNSSESSIMGWGVLEEMQPLPKNSMGCAPMVRAACTTLTCIIRFR